MVLFINTTQAAIPDKPPGPDCTLSTAQVCNNSTTLINDLSTVNIPILLSGLDSTISDIDLTTFITHTFASDLDITLTSPQGTMTVITSDNGGNNDDVFNGTLWDDQAGIAVTDHSFINSIVATPLVPEDALGAFLGENPNGTWTLSITDDTGADEGEVTGVCLDISTLSRMPDMMKDSNLTISVNTLIADNITINVMLPISGFVGSILDVDLTTFITHTFPDDLEIYLVSPSGTEVTLSTNNGGDHNDVFNGTLWDDSAGTTVNDAVYLNGFPFSPLVPEEALSALIGEDPNGNWTIRVEDTNMGDIGMFDSFSLRIKTAECASPPIIPIDPNYIIAIPTMGDWAIIHLSLIMMIIAVKMITNNSHRNAKI